MAIERRRMVMGAILGIVVWTAGCSREPEMATVSGKVTLNGKAMTVARLHFVPDRSKGNTQGRDARGKVDAEGVYTLSSEEKAGVVPGWYKVAVYAFAEVPEGGGPKPPEWLAPMHYADAEKSGLSVEVTLDPKPGQYDFELKK